MSVAVIFFEPLSTQKKRQELIKKKPCDCLALLAVN